MLPYSATSGFTFPTPTALPLQAAFDGGRLTSDGGLPWLAEADATLGLCALIAAFIPEWRKRTGQHSLETLVRQRVFQIAWGYEDQDDADSLRHDPLLKLVCGRLPDTGAPLASQPTLSRLDNAMDRRACYRLAVALVALYLRERERDGRPTRILLDLDGTDDPTYGAQEGTAYHAYYGQHMYHPLLIFDGDTNQLITAVLRPGNVHASRGVVAILKRLLPVLQQRWPGVQIVVRADSGFAVPALYDLCEQLHVQYLIGLVPNARLKRLAEPVLAEARAQQPGGKPPVATSMPGRYARYCRNNAREAAKCIASRVRPRRGSGAWEHRGIVALPLSAPAAPPSSHVSSPVPDRRAAPGRLSPARGAAFVSAPEMGTAALALPAGHHRVTDCPRPAAGIGPGLVLTTAYNEPTAGADPRDRAPLRAHPSHGPQSW